MAGGGAGALGGLIPDSLTPSAAQGIAGFLGTTANAIGPGTLGGRLGQTGAGMAVNSQALAAQNQAYTHQQERDDRLFRLLESLYGGGAPGGSGPAAYSPAAQSAGPLSPLSSLLGDSAGSPNPAGQTGLRDRLKLDMGPLKSLKIDPMGGVSYGFDSPGYKP